MLLSYNFKKDKLFIFFLILIGVVFLSRGGFSAPPRVISCHGRLTNRNKEVLPGSHEFTFRLYSQAQGGSVLWSETQTLTVDSNGLFSVYLGETNPLPTSLDFNSTCWVSIEVDGDGEMSPRIKLPSSAYALNSNLLEGLASSQLLRSDTSDVMEGTLTFKDVNVDIKAAESQDLVINAGSSSNVVNIKKGALKIGEQTPTRALGDGDLYISGDMEIDGNAYLDGGLGVSGNYTIEGYLEVNYTGTTHPAVKISFSPTTSSSQPGLEVISNSNSSGPALKVTHQGSSGEILSLYRGTSEVLDIAENMNLHEINLKIGDATPTNPLSGKSLFVENTLETQGKSYFYDLVSIGSGTPTQVGSAGDLFVSGNLEVAGSLYAGSLSYTDLDVAGNLIVHGDTILGDEASDTLQFGSSSLAVPNNLNIDSGTLFIDAANNRVGIGTTSPSVILEISGDPNIVGNLNLTPEIGELNLGSSVKFSYDHGNLTPQAEDLIRFYLDTAGDSTSEFLSVYHKQASTSREVFRIQPDGSSPYIYSALNLGIGTNSPSASLDVIGNSELNGNLSVTGNSILGDASSDSLTINASNLSLTNSATLSLATSISALNIGSNLLNLDTQNGYVGIGTSLPSSKLEVSGKTRTTTFQMTQGASSGSILVSDSAGNASWSDPSLMTIGNADTLDTLDSTQFLRSDTSDNYTSGTLTFDTGTILDIKGDLVISDTDITLDGANTNFTSSGNFSVNTNSLFIEASGNVGIGTTSPLYRLDISGETQIVSGTNEQLILRESSGGAYIYQGYDDTNDFARIGAGIYSGSFFPKNLVLQPAGGNVGIGTTALPSAKLQISSGDILLDASHYINFGNQVGEAGYGIRDNAGTLQFKNQGGGWTDFGTGVGGGGWIDDGTVVRLSTGTDSVGIGTTSPSYKLDVQGTGRFTDPLTIGAYTLPNTDGTSGYVLKTDGAGSV
ncbi:MAG: hypothetical protein DRP80_05855, partial [Candidatus Omnitrophota bacterium]